MQSLIAKISLAIIDGKKTLFLLLDIITDHLKAQTYEITQSNNKNEQNFIVKNTNSAYSDIIFFIEKRNILIKNADKSVVDDICNELPGIYDILSKINKCLPGDSKHPREYLYNESDNSRELIIVRDYENGNILSVNKKFVEVSGYSEPEIYNKDYSQLISEEMRSLAEKRFELVKKQKYLTGEIVYRKKNGEEFFVSLETIVTGDGKVIEFASDMSNWINILSALSESEYKFKQVFENSPVGKEIYNINNRIEKMNKKALEIFGIKDKRALKDWSLLEHLSLSQKQMYIIDSGDTLKIQTEVDLNVTKEKHYIETEKNEKIILDVYVSKVNIAENTKYTLFLQYQDITGRKKQIHKLERLREKSEAKAQEKIKFISNMSHEIRTPLNTIIGMAELLKDTEPSSGQQQYIKVLNKACDYLYAIINDILDLAKIDAGKLELEIRDFRLKTLIEDIIEIFEFKAKEDNIDIILEYDNSIPEYIKGDTYRLRQVLFNLLGNSLKFTDEGYIMIKVVNTMSDRIQISVKDTGTGIKNDRLKAIFIPFAQENNSTVRKYGGTGLGLSICSMIVKKLGGKIWAQSDYGHGSEFFFTFKYKAGKKHRQLELFDKNKDVYKNIKNSNILMIDDQEENRFLVSTYLKKIDVSIDEACSGRTGLDMIRHNEYNLIILDIQMPDMDGFEVLNKIREMEKNNTIKRTIVIAVTAYAMKDELEDIIRSGFDGYIPKPIKRKDFIDTLLSFLNKGN